VITVNKKLNINPATTFVNEFSRTGFIIFILKLKNNEIKKATKKILTD
jgi:hypothetical protein